VSFPLSAEVRRTQKKPEYKESNSFCKKWVQKTEGTDNPFQKMKSALSVSFALMYTQASDLFFYRKEKRPEYNVSPKLENSLNPGRLAALRITV